MKTPFSSALAWVRLAFFGALLAAQHATAEIIPAARMPASGWAGQVGIPGGIPTNYTQFCNVKVSIPGSALVAVGDGVTDDAPAINAALAACPDGQYVYLPPGTYRCNSNIGRTGVYNFDFVQRPFSIALKGAGSKLTKIISYVQNGDCITFANGGSFDGHWPITSGNTRGSTSITVATFNNRNAFVQVGKWIRITHNNDEAGVLMNGANGYMGDSASQLVRVTSVTGTGPYTINFTPALNEGYASDKVAVPPSVPYRCGIEDLYVERISSTNGHSINLQGAQECWVTGVESNKATNWHIRLAFAAGCEVRGNYVHDTWNGGGNSGYGVALFQYSCNNLVENNIAERCRHSYLLEYGGQNNVFGYNYSKDPLNERLLTTDYLMGDLITHGGNPRYNLYEGNVAATIKFDSVLGGNDTNTAFRNRIQRKGLPATYVASFGSDIQRGNYKISLVGNVYEAADVRFTEGLRRWGSTGDNTSNPDAQSLATAIVHGEYDITNINLIWDPNIADHTIPQSLYLTAKPRWFGNLAWPSIDSTAGTIPNAATAVSALPAGYRYVNSANVQSEPNQPSFFPGPIGDIAVPVGQTVVFTAEVEGSPAPTLQWQVSTDGGTNWTDLTDTAPYSGVTTNLLQITGVSLPLSGRKYRCLAHNVHGDATSLAATLTVNTPPSVTAHPQNATAVTGNNATFQVGADGTPAPTYQWQVTTNGTTWTNLSNAAPYSNVTTDTLTVAATFPLSGNQYRCVVTNSVSSATSNAATLTVHVPPSFTASPSNRTINAGTGTTFTATATGTPTPTLKWQISTDGGTNWSDLTETAPYSGVTSATLTLTNVAFGLNGARYRCVATNAAAPSGVNSSSGLLTVNVAPTFTAHPASTLTLVAGNAVAGILTVSATGNPAPTYRWQVSTNGGANWSNISDTSPYSGTGTNTLSITLATGGINANQYRCVATNSVASTNSTATVLTVNTAPAFTAQPPNRTVTVNTNTTFTATATGSPAPTLQWQVSTNGGGSWSNLANTTPYSGVTTGTLTITGAAIGLHNNQYRCVAVNLVTSVSSNAGTLTINTPPVITQNPLSGTVTAGGNITFTAAATGNPTPTFQWQVSTDGNSYTAVPNAAPYSGATTASLTITGANVGLNNFRYRAVASNSAGNITSGIAILTVGNAPPSFSVHPQPATVVAGSTTTFSVVVAGGPVPTLKWQVSANNSSWTDLTEGGFYANVTSATLTVTGDVSLHGLFYRCVATNVINTVTNTVNSSSATLTVTTVAPVFTLHPANKVFAANDTFSFTAAATGAPTPTLRWQVSTDGGTIWNNLTDTAPYSGSATGTLTITNAAGTLNNHRYRCVATNAAAPGGVASNAAVLTLGTIAPTITTQPDDQTVSVGANATFAVAASGTPAPAYKWQISTDGGSNWSDLTNTAPYSGANTATLTITGVTISLHQNKYQAIASNSAGSATSNAVTLAVATSLPTFTLHPQSQTVLFSSSATFTAAATGNPAPALRWEISSDGGASWTLLTNTGAFSGTTTGTLTITPVAGLDGNLIRANASNVAGVSYSNPATLTVQVPSPSTLAITSSSTANAVVNAPFSFTVTASEDDATFAASGLPAGFAINPTTGAITGTFTQTGTVTLQLTAATDDDSADGALTITVNAPPVVTLQPQGGSVPVGGSITLTVAGTGTPAPTYQWQRNGVNVPNATGPTLVLSNFQLTDAGAYVARLTNVVTTVESHAAVVGALVQSKIAGNATEVLQNRVHPNGNTYDQVLVTGPTAAVTADPNQVTRTSFIDMNNDIVQVELFGAGTLSVSLAGSSGPALPIKYNQNVEYMKGHASIVITGANETTHVSIFAVGPYTAVDQSIFVPGMDYDGLADLASVSIYSPTGKFGGLRTANGSYFNTSGITGVQASGVQFQGPVYIGDISAQDGATPVILLGSASDVRINGGDLLQANGRAVQVSGITQLQFVAGKNASGADIPAKANRARLEENGVDVTTRIVVGP